MADLSLAQSIVAAALSGIGALGTALHSANTQYKATKEELEGLQGKIRDAVLKGDIASWKGALESEIRARLPEIVNERFDSLRRGFRIEMDQYREDLDRKFRDLDRTPTRPDLSTMEEIRRRIETLDHRIDKIKEDQSSFVSTTAFSAHSAEQVRQWNELNRTLGQVLGRLKESLPPSLK